MTAMNIREAKKEIADTLCAYLLKDSSGSYIYPAERQRPIFLIGPPGIGKTAIVRQAAEENGVAFVSYAMTHHTRQSAVGLPKIIEETYGTETISATEYTMSEIIVSVYRKMKQTGRKEGILFLDEINCVSETLAPVMLEFLQNKTFGGHMLPEGWIIVAAGNPSGYNKSVRDFDMATLDRVREIHVEENADVFLDYARGKNLHGAVISYLTLKPDRFYSAEMTDREMAFVTARGWEDLSDLTAAYERIGAEVTRETIGEFLRYEDTARDYASYYALYRRYGTDFGIPELLEGDGPDGAAPEGNPPRVQTGQFPGADEDYRRKCAMASAGDFTERMAVTGQVLDYLGHLAALCRETEQYLLRLHETLKVWIRQTGSGVKTGELISGSRTAYDTKKKFGLLSGDELRAEKRVLERLEDIAAAGGDAEVIRAEFARDLAERNAGVRRMEVCLDRAFEFIADSFGEGAELTCFMTGLAGNPSVMSFIGQHGSDAFIRYSSCLMFRENEEKLQEKIRKAIGRPVRPD